MKKETRKLPKTDEEGYWWKVGYEAGIRESERQNKLAISIGQPILDAIYELKDDA